MKRIIAALLALLLTVCAGVFALADDIEYEGDAPLSPELMLRSDPDAGKTWSWSFKFGGVAEVATDFMSMEQLAEWNPGDDTYTGEGGYTWIRIDGTAVGVDTLILTYSDGDTPLSTLKVDIGVEDDLDTSIISVMN